MPTYFEPLLPNSSGLALGSASQSWALYASSATVSSLLSASANAATAGVIRLASADAIEWRNNANSANILLQKLGAASGNRPADTFNLQSGGGGGLQATLLSNTNDTMALAGAVRLSNLDTISWRNGSNSADVTLTVDGSNNFSFNSGTGNLLTNTIDANLVESAALSGSFGFASRGTTTCTVGSTNNGSGASGSLTLQTGTASGAAAGNIAITAGATAGAAVTGASITLTSGGTAAGAAGGNISLNTGTGTGSFGTLQTNTTVSKYGNISTTGNGLPVQYATVDLTAQTAAVGTTTLYAVPASGAGQYRLNWNAKVTTAGSVSSTLGALTIVYTDPDGVVQTITAGAQIAAGTIATTSTANTTATVLLGLPMLLNCKASTNVTYAFAYAANAAASMAYNLHLKFEALG